MPKRNKMPRTAPIDLKQEQARWNNILKKEGMGVELPAVPQQARLSKERLCAYLREANKRDERKMRPL